MKAAAGFGPPAIPPGGGGPGGVQETLERMQQKLERMQQKLERMDERLDQLQQGQVQIRAEMQARQANDQRRRQNRVAQQEHPRYADPLVPLVKEQPPPAGAAGAAAVGALPPANIFPQTWADVLTLKTAQLNDLAAFYGVQFGPGALADRREAFMEFIT